MIHVACSGFPVPTSRYFQECGAVEISDTELGIPGAHTCRRWLREAPEGFAFTVLAPKAIATANFELTTETKSAITEIAAFAKQLGSQGIVYAAAETFSASKPNRVLARAFAEHVQRTKPFAVLDLPGFSLKDREAVVKNLKVVVAYDPLSESPSEIGEVAYLRLPGPSGYRSRYDAAALDRVVEHAKRCDAKRVFVVFRNIDRFDNSRHVANALGSAA